jgi:hypothetical protein
MVYLRKRVSGKEVGKRVKDISAVGSPEPFRNVVRI